MFKALQLCNETKGISTLFGDENLTVAGPTTLREVRDGALTWVKSGANEDDLRLLERSAARAAIVCDPHTSRRLKSNAALTLLVTDKPRLTMTRLVAKFFPPPSNCQPGIHSTANVDPKANVDPTASIGAFCHVSANCVVGAGSILHPHVVLYENVRLGRRAIVHSGTTLGADGFGYERNENGELERFPHIGSVVIEDDVEIGSNSNVDRGALGETILRRGCKIDNQVHVGHNADVGEHVVVTAQCLIGARVVVMRGVHIAPSSIIMNQLTIGADAMVGTGSVVAKDVGEGETVMGSPAVPQSEFRETRAALKALMTRKPT